MIPRQLLLLPCLGIALLLGVTRAAPDPAPVSADAIRTGRGSPDPAPIDFNRDIRPILSDACFHCHGPDKAKRKADLRLDTEEGARKVIEPGKLDDSDLWHRITTKRDAKLMPPPKSGRKLTATQVDLLRRWIEAGAKWQPHWAFVRPQRPETPVTKNANWVRNPIDAFVLARLEREGLPPSPEAARSTLI